MDVGNCFKKKFIIKNSIRMVLCPRKRRECLFIYGKQNNRDATCCERNYIYSLIFLCLIISCKQEEIETQQIESISSVNIDI